MLLVCCEVNPEQFLRCSFVVSGCYPVEVFSVTSGCDVMEVSQRAKVQKTHNAGLVVTILLEVLALVLLCILECFLRYVHPPSSSD